MRIAVIGAGGIGGYFGGRLAAAGHDVTFVARGGHLEAIQQDGLVVESVAGDVTIFPARATADPREIGQVDLVMLCVKTWQLAPAIDSLASLVGPDSGVMTVQNGVEAPAQVATAFGEAAVLPGVARIFAFIERPGVIRHMGGPASLAFAEWDNRPSSRVEGMRAALATAGATVEVPEDIWAELWTKLLVVVPFGTLGAAANATIGDLRTTPSTRRLLEEAMEEIRDVAEARGIRLADDVVARSMAFLDDQPEQATTSLQRDLLGGQRSELEAWTGAVARLGEEVGVATPVHRVLYNVLSLQEARSARAQAEHRMPRL